METIRIFDTTLRDGEQSLVVPCPRKKSYYWLGNSID